MIPCSLIQILTDLLAGQIWTLIWIKTEHKLNTVVELTRYSTVITQDLCCLQKNIDDPYLAESEERTKTE